MHSRDAGPLRLTKHHGAGNDFLVVLDPSDEIGFTERDVRVLCDRHRGVGADGVIRVGGGRGGAEVSMDLRNADGSRAEMSGNGIRCLAQAAVQAGLVAPPVFVVDTDAGLRTVEYRAGEDRWTGWGSVDMGEARVGPEEISALWDGRLRHVDVGNPHLVALGSDPATLDLAALGPRFQASVEGGVNVEFIAVGEARDELVLRVWERGVGETLACGTGSVAAAAAASAWGLVGGTVRVHNPGGTLQVHLGAPPEPARLAGPVRKVADVSVDRSWLGEDEPIRGPAERAGS